MTTSQKQRAPTNEIATTMIAMVAFSKDVFLGLIATLRYPFIVSKCQKKNTSSLSTFNCRSETNAINCLSWIFPQFPFCSLFKGKKRTNNRCRHFFFVFVFVVVVGREKKNGVEFLLFEMASTVRDVSCDPLSKCRVTKRHGSIATTQNIASTSQFASEVKSVMKLR